MSAVMAKNERLDEKQEELEKEVSMKTASLVKTALLAALMSSTSVVTIPIAPVPITFQTFFALLAGATLGPIYGAASMFLYVLLGAIGLPVFSNGGAGLGVLLGPRGGYILGFIAAAYIVGYIVSNGKKSFASIFFAMMAGIVIIYSFGVVQLAIVAKMTTMQAFLAGVVPFIPLDIVKALVATEIARRLAAIEQ